MKYIRGANHMKQAIALLAFTLFLLLLASCATGVVMNDEDKAACKAEGCTAWTDAEILKLINKIFKIGYEAGYKST